MAACATLLLFCAKLPAQSQQLPYMNAGPNSVFAQIDFARIASDEHAWNETTRNLQSTLIDSGVVSALDLQASDKAVREFKRGVAEMKAQNSKDAIRSFERALKLYPDFVSAHNALGLAYLDQEDARAKKEFETAAKLDDRFPGPFLNLGLLDLTDSDFAAAESHLEKANQLTPNDPRILTALAFAQNGDHLYAESIRTVEHVHAHEHRGFANVHYIAAAAYMSLGDVNGARSQLETFLTEDPANPLSPVARQRLQALEKEKSATDQAGIDDSIQELPSTRHVRRVTFPNSEYLQRQVSNVLSSPDPDDCERCKQTSEAATPALERAKAEPKDSDPTYATWNKVYTIHQTVDETALFFSVTQHGHAVNDLSASDIQVRDNNKAPDRILQFVPQSELPLRLGLLIDMSESVKHRVEFEKRAAQKFINRILTNHSDLAFVEGFRDHISVTQDFTRDLSKLKDGIERLTSGGDGTSIFDAVFQACWKLSAYPDEGRTAKVLVVVTDGEDNSSHRSLKQAIDEAEAAGVTVYTVSTAERLRDETDANRVLKLMAERTGGKSMFPGNLRALDSHLNQLERAIRSRYLIAYKAADFKPDGRFRSIRVLAEKDGQRLHVQVRKGYYARAAINPN